MLERTVEGVWSDKTFEGPILLSGELVLYLGDRLEFGFFQCLCPTLKKVQHRVVVECKRQVSNLAVLFREAAFLEGGFYSACHQLCKEAYGSL